MKDTKDNFSKQSDSYLKFRPTYPSSLFEYLSSLTNEHNMAWDCGTGNGQSAVDLTKFYQRVYATDLSEQQIKNAIHNPQIIYKVEKAEQTGLEDHSVDLITISQALHWFEFDKFYPEAKRVLKNNGIIAAWAYNLPSISAEIDGIIKHFHDKIVDDFWQFENKLIDKEYSTLPFPFNVLSTPTFSMSRELTLDETMGLIRSWSAVQKFIDSKGSNPLELIKEKLAEAWEKPEQKRTATWKLILKVGRNT